MIDDDELIASLAGGDDTALRELFARHAPWLAARLRRALPPDDVEDVLQETFLAVWKNAKAYRPQGTPEARAGRPHRDQAQSPAARRIRPSASSITSRPMSPSPRSCSWAGCCWWPSASPPCRLRRACPAISRSRTPPTALAAPSRCAFTRPLNPTWAPCRPRCSRPRPRSPGCRAPRSGPRWTRASRRRPSPGRRRSTPTRRSKKERWLPCLRLGSALALTGAAIGLLQLGVTGASLNGGVLVLARNVIGITGIGLLTSLVTGGLLAWIIQLGYLAFAEYALNEAWRNPWTWPVRPPWDRGAWICASLVFAAGLVAFTVRGARTRLADDG